MAAPIIAPMYRRKGRTSKVLQMQYKSRVVPRLKRPLAKLAKGLFLLGSEK